VADYAPHSEEVLRDQHAHRRLGFPNAEVHGWFAQVGLHSEKVHTITGPRLTVMVWTATKPAKDLP